MSPAISNSLSRRRWRLVDRAGAATRTPARVGDAVAGRSGSAVVGRGSSAVAARGSSAVARACHALARFVWLATLLVLALIGLAVTLRLLGAQAGNSIVHGVTNAGGTIVAPFRGMFAFTHPKLEMLVNWGIAAGVYLLAGALVGALILRVSPARITRSAGDVATTPPETVD
jgi:hypothetical protein